MVWCLAAPAFAQTPSAGTAPAAALSSQPPDPQQIRQELDRLRQEFEAIRDSYGARLAALEAKLGTTAATAPVAPLPEATAPAAAPAPAAAQAAQPAPAGGVDVPSGAGGPQGSLLVYGGGAASSKVFNPD